MHAWLGWTVAGAAIGGAAAALAAGARARARRRRVPRHDPRPREGDGPAAPEPMEARPPEAAPRPEPAGALAAGCEEGETRTLLAIRVDGLADLRARFGDVTGQRALREVARAIRHALRERDTFERCHADRFVAVLPGVDAATAAEVAGRLQRAVSSLTVVTHGGDEVHLSAAVGRACAPADGATVEELREVADRDLDRPADGVPMPQADAAQRLRRALPLLPN